MSTKDPPLSALSPLGAPRQCVTADKYRASPMGGGSQESQRAGYHHGELRAALLGAGIALARQGGPDAVVLREASRRAGVSHTAAYRHFADREALLAAVAEAAAAELARAMEQRLARVRKPRRRLRAIGEAYIDFALREPGLFQTAFDGRNGHGSSAGARGDGRSDPFAILARALDELQATGELAARRRPGAEYAAWSAVHGLAMLLISGPLQALSDSERRRAITVVLDHCEAGLLDVS